jgi:hypothetical protein
VPDLRDSLELMVITYNRAPDLERTLESLVGSPFADCPITVLDNASTDATAHVCDAFQRRFRDMRVVRHPRNVGLSGNYLRAVELSRSPYTWVLADDDRLDFSHCDDVVEAIEAGRHDLISLGAPGQQEWERGLDTTARALKERGSRWFFVFTFVTNTIFRTATFDSRCVVRGYHNAANLYPQFEHIRLALERDLSVYVSRRALVARSDAHDALDDPQRTSSGGLDWLSAWVASCEGIDERRVRRMATYEAAPTPGRWWWMLATGIVAEKTFFPRRLPRRLGALALGLGGEQRMGLLLVLPLALVPSSVYRAVRSLATRGRPGPTVREVGESFDPMRQ